MKTEKWTSCYANNVLFQERQRQWRQCHCKIIYDRSEKSYEWCNFAFNRLMSSGLTALSLSIRAICPISRSYHLHADAEEKRDDWVTAVSNPSEGVALGVPEDVVQQRPLTRPLLACQENSPSLNIGEEFSAQTSDTTELKLDFSTN